MTAVALSTRPRLSPTKKTLHAVTPRPTEVPKLRYAVATLIGIFAILAGQLILSIALGNGAYEIRDLERQLAERGRDVSVLSEEIGALQDPQTLATMAVSLGMVDDGDPAYLRLSDARVIGDDAPAVAGSTALVSVVPGEAEPDINSAVSVMAGQAPADGESIAGFASMDGETSGVVAREGTIANGSVIASPTLASTSVGALGGDIPSPTTR